MHNNLRETRAEAEGQRDKENRRNNVILYSVVENNGGRAEDRNKDDDAFSLCHGITVMQNQDDYICR